MPWPRRDSVACRGGGPDRGSGRPFLLAGRRPVPVQPGPGPARPVAPPLYSRAAILYSARNARSRRPGAVFRANRRTPWPWR
jgi:hypothetical protein